MMAVIFRLCVLLMVTAVVAGCAEERSTAATTTPPPTEQPGGLNGAYDLTLDNGGRKHWTITSACDPGRPCTAQVSEDGTVLGDANLADGRWSLVTPTPTNMTCSSPPISSYTWAWDASTLAGTYARHVIALCGETERDETVFSFTMTKVG